LNIRGHITVVHVPLSAAGSCEFSTDAVLTEDDRKAIRAFSRRGLLDFLIVGNVAKRDEVVCVREFLQRVGADETKLLVKVDVRPHPASAASRAGITLSRSCVQNAECANNFAELMGVVDGLVLSRCMLGIHIAPESIALLQKQLLR
jgi:pyruvate kinase